MTTTSNEKEFTMADALAYQKRDLDQWRTVLGDAAFAALQKEANDKNAAGYMTPYKVFRGQNLTEFVINLAATLAAAGR